MYADDMDAGWEGPGQHLLTVYRRPVYCAGDPTGDYRCTCGGAHEDGDTLLSWESRETLTIRGYYDADETAQVEVING